MLVHRRVTPSSKFASTHLYSWVERGTMRVKCLAQEHNSMTRPGLEPGPSDPESNALTIRPPRHPMIKNYSPMTRQEHLRYHCHFLCSIPCDIYLYSVLFCWRTHSSRSLSVSSVPVSLCHRSCKTEQNSVLVILKILLLPAERPSLTSHAMLLVTQPRSLHRYDSVTSRSSILVRWSHHVTDSVTLASF